MRICLQRELKTGVFAVLIAMLSMVTGIVTSAVAAPVTQPGAWTAVAGQAVDGTSLAGSYTVGGGSNRLLLVALTAEFTGPVSMVGIDAYYGGERLSRIEQNSTGGEGNFAIWTGYLNEEKITAAVDTTLTISWSDDQVATSLNLFAATLADVNQLRPWKDKANNATAVNAPISFGADVDYHRESKMIYIAGYGGTNAGTTHVAGYTERLVAANFNSSVVTIADKDDVSSNGIAVTASAVDFAGTNANHGLVAFSINPVFNPLIHTSASTGSARWSGSGGWGVAGGKYGAFTCGTCHAKSTGNIKRVKALISYPDSSTMPNGATSSVVNLQTTQAPTSDFGNDTGAHATSSKVCEICHTYDATQANGTKFHAYDMSAGGADLSHENGNDCISCHLHSEGFAAGSCDGCHQANGVGHTDTSDNLSLHQAHTASNYTTQCSDCHTHNGSGPDHNTGTVNFNNTAISNTYNYPKAGSFGGTCGAVNGCHDSDQDEWENGDLGFAGDNACQDCHDSAASLFTLVQGWTLAPSAGPTSNEHQGHLSNTNYVTDCSTCHPHNGAMGGQHADTTLQETVSYNSGDGTCANTCHYVADTRDWTSATALDCADCHNADVAGGQADGYYSLDGNGWPPTGGSHPIHVGAGANAAYGDTVPHSTAGAYEFGCGQCHGSTASNHVNGANNVDSGLGYASNSCSTSDCHSHKDTDGVTTVYVPTPVWGGNFPAGDRCAQCHKNSPESAGHEEHQMGFHSEHVYSGKRDFLPVRNSDPLPANLVLGPVNSGDDANLTDDAYDPIRGHGGKLADGTVTSTIFTCYVCHSSTVNVKPNDQATLCITCHDDVVAPKQGDMVVANKSFHVNGVADVVFVNEAIRSKAQVRDELMDVPELAENWTRVGVYKANDGSSYDEQPKTLDLMAVDHGGWDAPTKTCQISCHLWEAGRVDKYPVDWIDNSIHGPQPIMCIDCHTRLPK